MSTTDPNPSTDPTTSSPRAEGSKLAGCYALSRRVDIGEGAEVWLANDEVLGKDVSLHFVPDPIRKDSRALQELRLDIKRNRQLIHPNILRVYDLVEEPDWVAISMDTFEGTSLASRLAAQPGKGSKLDEIQAWVVQLAQTLEEAHKINVFHRDVAPSNLFLTPAGKLLVANFGISRTISDAQARAGAAETLNTAYESPQLLDGQAPARTDDIYSLGAVLYAVVTGKAPFTGPNLAQQVRGGVSAETLGALQNADLSVPANWRTTIAACLDRNPESRPQSAAEVARSLAAAIESVPAAPAAAKSPVVEPAIAPAAAGAAVAAVVSEPVLPVSAPALAAPESKPAADEVKPAVADEPKPAAAPAEPAREVEPKPAPVVESKPGAVTLESKPAAAPEPTKTTPAPALAPKTAEPAAKESKKESPAPKAAAPAPSKAPERPQSKDFSPRLYPEQSRFPVTGLAVAAVVIVVIGIIYYFAKSGAPDTASNPPEQTSTSTSASPDTRPPATPPVDTSTPVPHTPVANTTHPTVPATPSVSPTSPNPLAKALAEKTAALDKAKANAQAAEKTHADLLKQQEAAQADLAAVQKSIEEKSASTQSLKKAADEIDAQRKKLESDKKAADAAAAEAQKMAAEKTRLAEESAKALLDLEKTSAEKMAAPQQVATEIATLQKTLGEKQRMVDDGAKALSQAEAARQQKLAAVTEQEQEIERLKSSDAEARKQQEAADAEQVRLEKELADIKARMDAIKAKQKGFEGPGSTPPPASLRVTPAPLPVTPSAAVTPGPLPLGTRTTPRAATATPQFATPIIYSSKETPPPSVSPSPTASSSGAVAGGNSLGMKFVPVGDVEFCIWQTRVKDFEIFANAIHLKSNSWKAPGFKQGPDHPVVNVSWQEALAFCKWLTDKEHKDNVLPASQFYRLPTDLEWSKAVGLPEESGRTPEMRDMSVPDVYPWGTQWPPPVGAGNYTGEETGSDVAIKGYDDSFAWTSPVGSFPPNKFGLFDMGGNVWQWCMDAWNNDSKAKVLRGASWYNGALKLSLLSSCRVHAAPDSSTDNYGFRIVRAKEEAKPAKK